MVALVSLAYAKEHLRRTDTDADSDISIKIEHASAIVMEHLKYQTVPSEWLVGSPQTVEAPVAIQVRTLMVMGYLSYNREGQDLSRLQDILNGLPRNPTLA